MTTVTVKQLGSIANHTQYMVSLEQPEFTFLTYSPKGVYKALAQLEYEYGFQTAKVRWYLGAVS